MTQTKYINIYSAPRQTNSNFPILQETQSIQQSVLKANEGILHDMVPLTHLLLDLQS